MENKRDNENQGPPAAVAGSHVASGTLPALLPCRVFDALILLYESHAYANDLGTGPWDFAVELRSLRRLGLTNSDLRWLVGKQLVDHAREVTRPEERQRSFRPTELLTFTAKTCFVLTAQGVEAAAARAASKSGEKRASPLKNEHLSAVQAAAVPATGSDGMAQGSRNGSAKSSNGQGAPRWDRDRQELRVGDHIVKQFKVPAANQETVLAAFEEEHWPPRIDDPLPPHPDQDSKRRLHDTINSLNRNQKRSLVRFLGDGSGTGIRWEYVDNHR